MNKPFLFGLGIGWCLLVVAGQVGAVSGTLDRIAAVVNDEVILHSELNHSLQALNAQYRAKKTPLPPQDTLRTRLLERMIIERLQLQRASQTGIEVDDETLNAHIRRIAKDSNMSIAEFRQALETDGFSFTKFREELRREATISRMRSRLIHPRVRVTQQEIDNLLSAKGGDMEEQTLYRLRHILLALPEGASPEQIQKGRKKTLAIRTEILQGRNFSETAIAVSDGQQALEGGDLGWRKLNQLPSLFAAVAADMQRGDISLPIRSPSGFHLVQLAEFKGDAPRMITQTQAQHILIHTNEMVSEHDARVRLQQLRKRIEEGEDFSTLARAHSDDKATAIKGGALGWVNPGDLVPQFEEKMGTLEAKQISSPFHTPFGWHIVQVLDRRNHDSTNEYQQAMARKVIRKRKVEEETQLFLRQLRDEAYVEYRAE